VAKHWIGEGNQNSILRLKELGSGLYHHVRPIMGSLSAHLGLSEIQVCRLFGYCVARDIVSAAVRLSLMGPLAGVPLLQRVQGSAEDGYRASLLAMSIDENLFMAAAGSSPIVEAIHPCHNVLQVRLFRS